MISVSEAKNLIAEHCKKVKIELYPLLEAHGSILAETVYSLIDSPPFNQSAMDGYAFSYEDWDRKSDFIVQNEIQAGNYSTSILKPFEAIRIFTGAALPGNADTVVIQEKVVKSGRNITVVDEQLARGSNVRLQGAQTKKGEAVLASGRPLTPAAISLLAGVGISMVRIFAKPSISIIATGKELVQPGNELAPGEIYESNTFGLSAALNHLAIAPVSVEIVDDSEEKIIQSIKNKLEQDILILTGGVSVGEYDFVASALEKCGVEKIFHKVRQKPGKPFYFGKYNQTLIFALPGNPAAVLACFYEYIVPAIMSFTKKKYFESLHLPLATDFKKKAGLTFFLKGKTGLNNVEILAGQESYLMNSFATADCLIELEEEKELFRSGELVNVLRIV